mmetsp:Transcript_6821/g.22974  ORF Transcript_6821/g.22974 Transcript_6821/m.22974 type:complete len:259 (+) Transcript_6821:248-1024(+)
MASFMLPQWMECTSRRCLLVSLSHGVQSQRPSSCSTFEAANGPKPWILRMVLYISWVGTSGRSSVWSPTSPSTKLRASLVIREARYPTLVRRCTSSGSSWASARGVGKAPSTPYSAHSARAMCVVPLHFILQLMIVLTISSNSVGERCSLPKPRSRASSLRANHSVMSTSSLNMRTTCRLASSSCSCDSSPPSPAPGASAEGCSPTTSCRASASKVSRAWATAVGSPTTSRPSGRSRTPSSSSSCSAAGRHLFGARKA